MAKLGVHLAHLNLIDTVFRYLIDDLVHLDEELCADLKFTDNFLLHSHVMTFVLAEKCTSRADANPILDANDFQLALMLITHLFDGSAISKMGCCCRLYRSSRLLHGYTGFFSFSDLLLELCNL